MSDDHFGTREEMIARYRHLESTSNETIATLKAECEKLRAFANEIMDCWPDGDVDGGFLQEVAIEHGMIAPHEVTEPCNPDGCQCAEFSDFPLICYRRTSMLDTAEVLE